MSLSRSSKLGLALLSALVLFAAVGVASAVSVEDEQGPEEVETDQDVTVTVELQDLFAQESSWELSGQTELQDAQWTVEFRQNGEVSNTREGSGDMLDPIYLEEGVTDADTIVVEITGQAPAVSNTTYADQATLLAGEVVQLTDGGNDPTELSRYEVPHYSSGDPGSKEARAALDQANDAIESTDGDTSAAESTFDDAVAAYDSQEFADAISLAEEAESQLQSSSDGSSDGSDDGSQSDGGSSDDGTSDDGSGNGTASDGGSGDDGSTDDGSENDSTADAGSTDNSSTGESGSGNDGGLLWPILYGLLGLLILGGILGGVYWYQQQGQGPSRDPLG